MDTYRSTMFPIYLAIFIIFWIGFSDFIRISCITNNPDAILKEKKRKIPRITLACIACMYLYLSAVALRMFFFSDSLWNGTHIFAFTFWLIVPCVLSFLNLITVQKLCGLGMTQQVKRSWIGLKLSFLPFLLLNAWLVLHSTNYINPIIIGFACVVVVLLPVFLLLLSLPMFILPLAINAMYGGIGIKYIRQLKQQTGNKCYPFEEYYAQQLFPGLDLVSMLLILMKCKESSLDTKVSETDSVTVQSPYTAQSPYPAKTAPATKPTIYKKIEKYRKIFFLLYLLCGILFYFRSELVESTDEVYEEITAEETNFYEMTEEEIALIQDHYWEKEIKEKIAAGQLTGSQAELLENLRIGYSYIERKYPDGQFQIEKIYHQHDDSYYIHDSHTTVIPEISYYTLSIVPVQPNGRVYRMEFSTSPDSAVEDNLYVYMQEDSYFQYMENQLAGKIPGLVKLDIDEWYDWYMTEYEDPADLTVSSILHGEYVAGPRFVDVYIAANGKTADECKRQKKTLSEIFRCIELPVERYTVYYYELTVQEISMGDLNPGSAIAAFSIYP